MINKKLIVMALALFITCHDVISDMQNLEREASTVDIFTRDEIKTAVEFLKNQPASYALDRQKEDFAQQQIKNGTEYLKALSENKLSKIPANLSLPFEQIQKDYLNVLIALSWGLFNRAVQKGCGFTHGTIVFEDPEFKIFNFFFNYVNNAQKSLEKINQNCVAYKRPSSHFPELQKNSEQYGIDIRFGNDKLEKLLPGNKAHILFGKMPVNNKECMFIKMEKYGLCVKDGSAMQHGMRFLKGTGSKKGTARRENVPEQVTKLLQQLINKLKKEEKNHVLKKIGEPAIIKNIYPVAQQIASQKNSPAQKEAQDLVKYLEDTFDHLDIRRGNEVILD
jgi:hypothetical protein